MEGEQAKVIAAALREIRNRVGDILKESPTCGAPAGDMLQALAQIEDAVFVPDSAPLVPVRDCAQGGLPRKRNQPKRYVREHVGGSEVLSEYRGESAIPLRSPHEILEAVVQVLSQAEAPMLFGDLQEELGQQCGAEPPEYQTRTVLRFLSSKDVGLVTRKRARYTAIGPPNIRSAARQAWDSMTQSK